MQEILESKIFVSFILFCLGCMYFTKLVVEQDNLLVQKDTLDSTQNYAYMN